VAPLSLGLRVVERKQNPVAPGFYEDSCALLITPDLVMPPTGKGVF